VWYSYKNIAACLRYKLIVSRLKTALASLILLVSKSTKFETFINTKVIYFVSAYACIWINAWLLILVQCTDVFVYCSLLYTNLLVRFVETVGECRSNSFFISFKRFVKTVRKGVKFFVFIRSYFSLKTSKTFWRSVKTIWQSVYYPFIIRFFARFNARSLTYVSPWKVTYTLVFKLKLRDQAESGSSWQLSFMSYCHEVQIVYNFEFCISLSMYMLCMLYIKFRFL
jgi:hypothetical protein